MDSSKLYALATSSWLALQALPLLLVPRLIHTLTSSNSTPRAITDFETYLSRTLGITLLTLSLLTLLLTGLIPIATKTVHWADDPPPSPSLSSKKENIYAHPTTIITTIYHALTSFYLYTQLTSLAWNFAFTAGLIGSSALFCFGLWAILFAGSARSLSRSTGADRHTSSFPFANRESGSAVKKEKRREEKEKEKEKRKSGGSGRTAKSNRE